MILFKIQYLALKQVLQLVSKQRPEIPVGIIFLGLTARSEPVIELNIILPNFTSMFFCLVTEIE
jgi:hypothetical protein